MTELLIKDVLQRDFDRRIEEVIKVDQTDAAIVREEIDEYVVTEAIRARYRGLLREYAATPNKPHEGIAVWVSGFFGSNATLASNLRNLPSTGTPICLLVKAISLPVGTSCCAQAGVAAKLAATASRLTAR